MNCSICNQPLSLPIGNLNSPILLIRHTIADDPMADVALRNELGRAGLSLDLVLQTYLVKHTHMSDICSDADFKVLVEEIKGKRAVLLMGSEVVEFATNLAVMDVSGMRVTSYLLPSVELMMACPSPGIVLNSAVGEFRLAIQKFVKAWKNIERSKI